MPPAPPRDDFGPIMHSADDAGRVQDWLISSVSGSTSRRAHSFLVIPRPWQKETCCWYDLSRRKLLSNSRSCPD
eukprot:3827815-Pyramimonas_sp.AAC.1